MTSGGTMSHVDVSKETYDTFLRCAHINFRIIACLRAKKALDMFQVSQLSGEKSLIKGNVMVFEWIEKSQSLYDIFLQVMQENEQQHVTNLLKGIKDGPHIPLLPPRYTRLVQIAPTLMDIIRNDTEFVANLRAKHAISEIDRQDIIQEKKEYKRNWNLIEAILRRSKYAFDCFDQALRETLQVHVANYLHEGQVVAVHANTTHPDKEEAIADLFNKAILSESKDDTSSEEKILTPINGYNIHPVVAKPGQSIVFFLYCKTIDDMITFTKLFNSGDLQSIVEVIFNRLLSTACPENMEQMKARLSLDRTEILAVEKFSGIEVELEKAMFQSKVFQNTATQAEELQIEGKDPCPPDTISSQVMDYSATMERNREILLRCVNIDVHLVACLRAEQVIDQAMESRLEAEKAPHDKRCLLIDWIKMSPYTLYESFLKVMEENNQQHVVNLLKGNEETKHVPLSLAKHARLVKIRPKLMHMIHNNVSLIAELLRVKAISEIDAEYLNADKGPNIRKNFCLINAILRRSDYSFECLYDALRNCHHPDAADYLIEGETFAVHVNTSPSGLDESLAESLNESVVNESENETAPKKLEMAQLHGLPITGAYPGYGIIILIYCKTTEKAGIFRQLFKSVALQKNLQDILNHHFTRIKPESTEKLEARIELDDGEVLAVEEITGIEV